jgi:hypothetical protein
MREKDQARYFFRKDHPLENLICQNDFKQIDKAVAGTCGVPKLSVMLPGLVQMRLVLPPRNPEYNFRRLFVSAG